MMGEESLQKMEGGTLRRFATYASIAVATVLIAIKMIAFFKTDSVAMLSSLLDSTLDLLTALITAYGVASALQPPDHDHRYGHGKAEPLAALAQSAFIIGSSVLLSYEALSRLYHPQSLHDEGLGYAAMAVAIVLTLLLVGFQRYVIYRTRSMAIGADHIHYIGDLAINFAVVAAFALTQMTGAEWYDPVFAIIIAIGMTYGAIKIAHSALNVLMDRELPDDEREKIKSIVRAQQDVHGLHDLRTRTDGERVFIEFHLELDAGMTLRNAHKIDEALMAALRHHFPNSDILIHQDPAGLHEERLDEKIQKASKA
ncbi:MAG TPA: cation diffusion facilitator family transporter [Alphaproteobacteria bacterium]|nr:cation diffusion facilitator family transporter [Alphaproteobacteria bacterium]